MISAAHRDSPATAFVGGDRNGSAPPGTLGVRKAGGCAHEDASGEQRSKPCPASPRAVRPRLSDEGDLLDCWSSDDGLLTLQKEIHELSRSQEREWALMRENHHKDLVR